jgi:hypothetical protein
MASGMTLDEPLLRSDTPDVANVLHYPDELPAREGGGR